MAVDKSTWNKKVKVSQSTIDDIKGLGMAKALRLAKMNAKGPQAGLVKEYQEATRRLYGDRRFAAATGASATPKKMTGQPSGYRNPKQAGPKPAASKKASTKYSPTPMKTPAKKSNNTNTALKVAGGIAAAGVLLASRGKAAGLATKLAPGLMKNKVAQALLTGEVKKAAPKVVSKVSTKTSTAVMKAKDAAAVARGKAAAKAGKPVSQSQYDAMVAAAKAGKGKAVKGAASKTKTALDNLSARGQSRWDANAPKPKAPKKPKK
jgi:hypothetical protein